MARAEVRRPRAPKLPHWAGPISLIALLSLAGAAVAAPPGEAPAMSTAHPADAAAAIAQLRQMSEALNRLEYEGTLVYLHGDQLAAMRLAHRIDNGVSRESLLALNGPIRAVARTEHGVTCVFPDAHPILVDRKGMSGSLLRTVNGAPGRIDRHYLVHPLGGSRVAGREASVIGIIPRDQLRYGYRFYLDRLTRLPLKIDLMDGAARPVEQMMFTDIAILGDAAGTVEPASSPAPASAVSPPRDWALRRMPAGFDLVMYDREVGTDAAAPVDHLLLSDGLASISIYIEGGDVGGLDGPAQMGAVHAAGARVGGHQVTVVGEVPAGTVEAVLRGVRPAGGDTPQQELEIR